MFRSTGPLRGILGFTLLAILIAVIALPTLAADPSSSPEATPTPAATPTPEPTAAPTTAPTAASTPAPTAAPAATAEPTESAEPEGSGKPDNSAKPDKAAKPEGTETPVTITGTVGTRTDADGETEYTLTSAGKIVVLDAGPPWFYGDKHPLKTYVGKKVTITGSQDGTTGDVEVNAVDGKVIREPGKPPWAGGWKAVGSAHPGWSQEKWDRWQAKSAAKAKAFGTGCWPPGQCKDTTSGDTPDAGDLTTPDAGG